MKLYANHIFLLCLSLFLFSSCAYLLNGPKQNLHIYCKNGVQLMKVEGATVTREKDSTTVYIVRRSKKPIILNFRLSDSIQVNYTMKGRLSPAYLAGNLFPYAFPIGYVVDLFHPNRFRYKPNSYFSYDAAHNKLKRKDFVLQQKNYLDVYAGLSCLNLYHQSLFPKYEAGRHSVFGLSLQVNYFFRPKHSLFFEAGISATPGGGKKRVGPVNGQDSSYIDDHTSNSWFLLGYKYHIKRFSVGAGVCIAPSTAKGDEYRIISREPYETGQERVTQHLTKAGVVINAAYNLGGKAALGVNWQIYGGDLNRKSGAYVSHFFNFYVTFKAFKFQFYKSKQVYEYN